MPTHSSNGKSERMQRDRSGTRGVREAAGRNGPYGQQRDGTAPTGESRPVQHGSGLCAPPRQKQRARPLQEANAEAAGRHGSCRSKGSTGEWAPRCAAPRPWRARGAMQTRACSLSGRGRSSSWREPALLINIAFLINKIDSL